MAWGYNAEGQYGWIPDGSTPSGAAAEHAIAQGAQFGGGVTAPGGGGLAKQVSNPGTNGSNARYHVGPGSGMSQLPNGNWTDGVYEYDSNGLSLNRPDSVQPGLPPANESESYDVYTGAVKSGGGGSAAGGSYSTGGSSDPYVQQIKSMLQAQSAGDAASTKAMLQKMLIGFGMVPEGFEDKLGVLDDLTKSLVAKNTETGISQYARLLQAKGDNTKALIGRLSATGMRRSGTRGAKLRKGQLEYDRLLSDSLNEVLDRIGAAYGNYTSGEQSRQMQMLAALQNSQGNYWSGAGSSQQQAAAPGGGFTPIWQGTWAQGIDTGGYVPNSGQITYQGNLNTQGTQNFNLGGGVVAY